MLYNGVHRLIRKVPKRRVCLPDETAKEKYFLLRKEYELKEGGIREKMEKLLIVRFLCNGVW